MNNYDVKNIHSQMTHDIHYQGIQTTVMFDNIPPCK